MQELNVDNLKKIKTPYYLYDTKLLENTLKECLSIANPNDISIHFSIKANYNEKILNFIKDKFPEVGADCVSGGEVKLAMKYFSPEKIVFAGISKSDEEIETAVDNGIFCMNVESMEELDNLNRICTLKKKRMNFACRINPNFAAHTIAKITTGLIENKFGFYLDKFEDNFYNKIKDIYTNKNNEYSYLNFIGLHFHIGSQILDFSDFKSLCKRIDEIVDKFNSLNIIIEHLNLGGGLGVDYVDPEKNPIPDFKGFFETYLNNLSCLKKIGENFNGNKKIKLHFELGRSIICQCGNLICKVNYIKQGIEKKFCMVDAGMNDLIRPALYGANHKIEKVGKAEEEEVYDIVGPICESSDIFARNYKMGKCQKGDYIVIRSAGAYGESMSSQYCFRDKIKGYLDRELIYNLFNNYGNNQ